MKKKMMKNEVNGNDEAKEKQANEEQFLSTGMSYEPKLDAQKNEERFLETGMGQDRRYSDGGEVQESSTTEKVRDAYRRFMDDHQLGTFPKLEESMKNDPSKEMDPGKYMGEFSVNASTKNYAGGGPAGFPYPTESQGMEGLPPTNPPEHYNPDVPGNNDLPPFSMAQLFRAMQESGKVAFGGPSDPDLAGKSAALLAGGQSLPAAAQAASTANGQRMSAAAPMAARPPTPQQSSNPALMGLADPAQYLHPDAPPSPPMAMPPAPSGPPTDEGPAQSLSDTASALNKTPDTNYDFYKNMDSNDRANLYSQLSEQQKGPGALIAQGLGGVGDALSALGGQKSTFLKDIQGQQEKRKEGAMGAFDTQRAQKMQDLQANVQAMSNDPRSPLNVSAREWVGKAMGQKIPSGMTVVQLEKLVPGIGDMMMKQMAAEEAARSHKEIESLGRATLGSKEDIFRAEHPVLNYFNPVGGGSPNSPISNPNAPQGMPGHKNSSGWSVKH